jgi:alpha-tubulin suppressor-like RCC1 family protein
VTQVAAGHDHSLCVISDGTVWSWGLNTSGQLGTGVAGLSKVPQLVSGISGTVTRVAAGWTHSLALGSDGTVWAWGNNQYNELGPLVQDVSDNSDVPVQVTGLSGVTQIAAGASFGMAIRTTVKLGFLQHSVWTWGQEVYGQVGNGQQPALTSASRSTPPRSARNMGRYPL